MTTTKKDGRITCPKCGDRYTARGGGHCSAISRLAWALKPAVLFPEGDSFRLQSTPDGHGVNAEDAGDAVAAESVLIEDPRLASREGLAPLSMMNSMIIGSEQDEVLWTIVGLVPVDVVDVLIGSWAGDRLVLVRLDVLTIDVPSEQDVAIAPDVPGGLTGWHLLVPSEPSAGSVLRFASHTSAGVAATSLPSGSRHLYSAVHADDHPWMVAQWLCHKSFTSNSAADAHRTGSFSKGTRRCLTVEEMTEAGWRHTDRGWTNTTEEEAAQMRALWAARASQSPETD